MGLTLDQISQESYKASIGSVFREAAAYPALARASLLEAMSFDGGEDTLAAAKILLRAAAPAVLCASHPDIRYPRTEEQVIAAVNSALAAGDCAPMLELAEQLASNL